MKIESMEVRLRLAAACAILPFLACSSSIDEPRNVTADGFRISIKATPDTIAVGRPLTITMIAENTTDAAIMRAFPAGSFGPEPALNNSNLAPLFNVGGGFFGDFLLNGQRDTLKLAPHASASGAWQFIGIKEGQSILIGCFPEHDDALEPKVCTTRTVTITAN